MKLKHLPNALTAIRMIGTFCLLFVKPFTALFYIIYTISGLSDIFDGLAARKLKLSSEFGAKLDSIADLLFYTVMLFRIFPTLWDLLPRWIWAVVATILVIRAISYTVAALKYKRFASIHTYMNKLTGAVLFAVPYFLALPISVHYCFGVCVIGMLASLEELIIHATNKQYDTKRKSLFINR